MAAPPTAKSSGSLQPKNNMKVGVVTFHNAHNYGATLQTWALQKTLKKLDAEPCVVHYHPDIIEIGRAHV